MSETRPPVSVVVGALDAAETIGPCLDRLVPQCEALGAELVVVDGSSDGTNAIARAHAPAVRVLRSSRRHIPEFWAEGIAASRGEVVALTTAHAVPAANWLDALLREHRAGHVGVGGAVACAPEAGWVDWAVYLCRYSAFMPPFEAREVPEIAGDNASYRRDALEAVSDSWRAGFWEPPVHAALRARGGTLWLSPAVVVEHRRSFSARAFLRNRWEHGRQYGHDRAAGAGCLGRWALAARTPLVPAVLLARVGRRVFASGHHLGAFVAASPLLLAFYAAWAAGEAVGALSDSAS